MLTEYWKKVKAAIKWLVPFLAAVFLLFGCSPAGSAQADAKTGKVNVTAETRETAAAPEEGGQALPEEMPESQPRPESQSRESSETDENQTGETEDRILAGTEEDAAAVTAPDEEEAELSVSEDGHYTSKEEVALYLHIFGHLPENYITKKDAEAAGWVSREGNLWEVAPGMSIGGSRFGNYEGLLPDKKGRTWYECDIDFDGSYRGAKRIIYSNDGLIYYTEDHYKSFEQLY